MLEAGRGRLSGYAGMWWKLAKWFGEQAVYAHFDFHAASNPLQKPPLYMCVEHGRIPTVLSLEGAWASRVSRPQAKRSSDILAWDTVSFLLLFSSG